MDSRPGRSGAAAEERVMDPCVRGPRAVFGRTLVAGAALTLLLVATPAQAHNPLLGEFTCPLCRESYTDVYLGPWPFYITGSEPGMGPELRVWSYMDPGHYEFMCCPHCGYCNEITGFHLVCRTKAEVRKNPYAEPPAKAKKNEDQKPDENENADNYRAYVGLFAAEPLDFATLKATLARSVNPSVFRYVNAYFPERLDILLRTLPGLTAWKRFHVALTGAWTCDDSGETKRGLDFRTQAIEVGRRLIGGEFPPDTSDRDRLTVRYQVAEMQLKVGRARGDDALRAEGRRAMEAVLKSLAAVPAEAEENAATLARLRDQIRQRAAQIGLEASAVPDWPENIDSKDPQIAALVEEIRQLFTRTWMPMSGQEGLDAWIHEGRKHLAADAFTGLPVKAAMAAVRDGSPLQREAFLMLYGWRWREPAVREFVRDLLLPLSAGTGREPLRDGWALGGQREEEETEASRQFDRYVLAIAQSHNFYHSTFSYHDILRELLPEQIECQLPKPPDPAPSRGSKNGEAKDVPLPEADSQGMIFVKMIPANENLIRRCLAALDDAPNAEDNLHGDQGRLDVLETLCRVDAKWLASLLLEDLGRRPRLYIRAHRSSYRFSETPFPADDWPSISPERLIAKHLPNRARQAARDALQRLVQGNATPYQAAAALTPLQCLEDAKSLEILRQASTHSEALVRRMAQDVLRARGDPWLLRLLLDEAAREGNALTWLPGNIPLLDRTDVSALRKILPAARKNVEAADRHGDNRARDDAEEELAWILAALGHLGDAEALREYNAFAFRVGTRVGDPQQDDSEESDAKMFHTPVTARCADLETMLWLAQTCYCSEAMADELLDGVRLLPHWHTGADVSLLAALASNPKTHDRYRRLASNLAPRPIPLDVKRELLRHAADIQVPEVTQAVRRWARSGDPELAHDAREALRHM